MTASWRLLDMGPQTAAENMALDEVLLEARDRAEAPNTLRFLQFSPPCALVGYHQAVEQEIRISYCRERGIDINRRLTGGGGLFWDASQLGWEIVAARDALPAFQETTDFYAFMCQGAIQGLETLGVRAMFRPKNDIEVGGRKISGAGGTSQGQTLLFQGTLLVDFDAQTMLEALRIPVEKLQDKEIASVRQRVTCLRTELGFVPLLPRIKAALVAGFARTLGASFAPAPLTPFEEDLWRQRLPFFQSDEWIYGVRRPLDARGELRATLKCRGGLIRVALLLENRRRRIREAFITGDFFAHPRRALHDLEARLKGAPAEKSAVAGIVNEFFREEGAHIPGVTVGDIVRVLDEALDKLNCPTHGIPSDAVNAVFPVVRPLAEVGRESLLLLPYCAKLPGCEYRFQDGCSQCGACSVGDAYALGERYGLTPVTIQNYEMLEETLRSARRAGVHAFVGCCCEAFYAKHRADFEEIGLAGILVDVDSSTCYDLGQVDQAKAGRFERQTHLRLDLLERVLARGAHGERDG